MSREKISIHYLDMGLHCKNARPVLLRCSPGLQIVAVDWCKFGIGSAFLQRT